MNDTIQPKTSHHHHHYHPKSCLLQNQHKDISNYKSTASTSEVIYNHENYPKSKNRLYVIASIIACTLLCIFVVVLSGSKMEQDSVSSNEMIPMLSSSSSSSATTSSSSTTTTTKSSSSSSPFPNNFIWGTGTSAYQIEGATSTDGRTPSIWDTFCTIPNKITGGSNGDVACDHYHLFESDIRLMKEMGLKYYRFSISWTRILPNGTTSTDDDDDDDETVNRAGIEFYNRLLDTLLQNDIEPWVTLHHWDVPQTLQDSYGGWMDRQMVRDFTNYARVCFREFGDKVTRWVTINESWTIAVNGYASGVHAPGRYEHSNVEPYVVGHHLLLAHAAVVKLYRAEFGDVQRGKIGISNSGDFRYPTDESSEADKIAAERSMEFQLGWFSDPIWRGDYPTSMRERLGDRLPFFTEEEKKDLMWSADFLGLNHYSSMMASQPRERKSFGGYWGNDLFVDLHNDPKRWKQNCMGWNIAPAGMKDMLLWIHQRYNQNVTTYITENGSCFEEPNVEAARHDADRQKYLQSYIQAVAEAMEEGVDVRGYFAWSLMDNFEWQFGYTRRFGLFYVDFDTLERVPKYSALWYRDTIKMNGANIFMVAGQNDE